ncbi:hypothetical protein SLS62_001377 [Diatrype stigma]|uniref:Uncharacterized protein n=1 Tax=Diatrype stigma TaxID=117547 RepID=A0AAN9UZX5_9PEZI
MWPMMGHILMPDREPIERVLFRETIEDNLRLDATIYAQWTVMFSQNTTEKRTPLLALNRVLKRVREAIATGTVTETIMFCILVLSAKPLGPTLINSSSHGLFQPPAPQAGCIDRIGAIECHCEHIDVLRRLVRECGGILKIKAPSLQEHLQYIDLLDASQRVTAPAFELCFSYNHVLETDMARCRLLLKQADTFPVDEHFKEIILGLRYCCQILDDLCNEPQGADQKTLPYRMLPTYREIVHHRLLSLPRGQPNTEICRLATLIFSYGVTLPLPNPRPIRSLVQQLKEALTTPSYAANQNSELMFWATMLGAMASFNHTTEDDLHIFFLDRLRILATELAIFSWEEARALLDKFVWLSRACDDGARYVWENLLVDRACDGVVVRFPQLAI